MSAIKKKEVKTKIFYHGDMDGIAAANIYFQNQHKKIRENCSFIEFKYEKQNEIKSLNLLKEQCVFVDCCPSEDVLEYVTKNSQGVTVIDHHISQKENFYKFFEDGLINGIMYVGASATLITWCWFYFKQDIEQITLFLDRIEKSKRLQDESNIPFAIRLVNSWDIWNGMYVDAEPYKIFFEAQQFTPDNEDVTNLLFRDIRATNAIRDGYIMKQYYKSWSQRYINSFGYETKYEDKTFFVANVGCANSKVFGEKIKDYDAVVIYCFDGNIYKCSIYTEKEDFDCSTFAKNLGGGGHKKAAGFTLKTLPNWLKKKGDETDDKN